MNSTTATAAPRQRKPRPRPARSVRMVLSPSALHAGLVRIAVGKASNDYLLERLPSDFGAAFRLVKVLGDHDAYHVCLDGERSLCDCKGCASAKSGRCKHIDGLQALVNAGKL